MTLTEQIIWDWGVRTFGQDHMQNLPLRTLRFTEEAVEVAQAVGIPEEKMHLLIERVYNRPPGNVVQELGGVAVTLSVLCSLLGVHIDSVLSREVLRVLNKPAGDMAKRNLDKIAQGLD